MQRTTALLALALWGCGGNEPPRLAALDEQTAFVNHELNVALSASDADGDALTFGFAGEPPAGARIDPLAAGRALLRWTPLISDAGAQALRISVSDGEDTDSAELRVRVQPSSEGATAPQFVQPLGSGTTIDVLATACLTLPIVVTDPDTADVTLGQAEPLIEGATLTQDDGASGSWSWCPKKAQIAADDRYALALSADDGDNAPTRKDYLIVLKSGDGAGCPGQAPSVTHESKSITTIDDVTVLATVTDDLGLKYGPLLYFSAAPPGDPPDVTQMTQLSMDLRQGTPTDGVWGTDIPNPVAAAASGSSAQLYYIIAARDNDDDAGNCDHTTQAPTTGSYAITVTNGGGGGNKSLCDSCSADAQCGGAGDLCIFIGAASHCGTACSATSDCPSGHYCSFASFTSVNGASGRQCIPNDYVCNAGASSCVDDAKEDNDTMAQAASNPALGPGNHPNLVSCASAAADDEDWYRIVLAASGTVSASIAGGSTSDLDLSLVAPNGAVLAKSDSLSSNESVEACLPAGTYYLRVFAYGGGENNYTLSYALAAGNCASACVDDENEPDDDAFNARMVDLDLGTHVESDQAICSLDDDWYAVWLYAGETLHASLTFTQTNASEDLDLNVYDASLTNLTGCTESTPSGCDPLNGGSASSNETLAWPIASTGTYYLVVHGWDGSANDYDICIGLSAADCP
jgi:hypothetical protein